MIHMSKTNMTNSELFDETLKTMIPYFLRREKGMDGKHKYPVMMVSAYTTTGKYIGHVRLAKRLVKLHGVMPKRDCEGPLCRLGQSSDGKWYGWNPRYYAGFGVGDVIKKNSVPGVMLGIEKDVMIISEEGAKRMAIRVARGGKDAKSKIKGAA